MKRETRSGTRVLLIGISVAALSVGGPVPRSLLAADSAVTRVSTLDPERLVAAKELMAITGSAKQFDVILPLIMRQIEDAFVKMKPEHEAAIRETFKIASERFSERKQEAFDQVAIVFAERFTAGELREIIAFYQSPVGAKLVGLQPEIAQKSLAIGQAWGRKIAQEIDQEVRKELEQRGVKL